MANLKGIVAGALVGTLMGSLAVLLYPKRREIIKVMQSHPDLIPEKIKEYAASMLNQKQNSHFIENPWKLGLLGIALGAAIGIAIAPKSGKQLRAQMSKKYNDMFDKTQEVLHTFHNNAHPVHKSKKRVVHSKR